MGGDGDAPGMPETRARMTDIRRYDGDASTVLSRWSVGGESPTSSSSPAQVVREGRCRRWARQASVQERRWIQKETTPRQRRRARPVLGNRPTER